MLLEYFKPDNFYFLCTPNLLILSQTQKVQNHTVVKVQNKLLLLSILLCSFRTFTVYSIYNVGLSNVHK